MKRFWGTLVALALAVAANSAMAEASYYNCKEGAQPIYPFGTAQPYSLTTYREWDCQKPGDQTTGGWVDGDMSGDPARQIGACWLYADLTKGKDYVFSLNQSSGLFLQVMSSQAMTYSKFSLVVADGSIHCYIRANEWSAFDSEKTYRFYVKVSGAMGSVGKPFTLIFREASIDDIVTPPEGSVKNPIKLPVTSGGSRTIVDSFDRPVLLGRMVTAYAVSLKQGYQYDFAATHKDFGVYLTIADWTVFDDPDRECVVDLEAGTLSILPQKNCQAVIYAMPDDDHWEEGNVGGGTLSWTVKSGDIPDPPPPPPPPPPTPTLYWTAREVQVSSFDCAADGTLARAKLSFGEDNGLTNRLYVAWGARDGGIRIGGWDHSQFVCDVPETMSQKVVELPAGVRHARFFLDVPFPAGNSGELLEYVKGDGNHYIDTGIVLKGGDDIRARVRPDANAVGSLFGSRGANVNTANIVMAFSDTWQFVLDYCGSGVTGDYAKYRLTGATATVGRWCDAVLSADVRSLAEDGGASSSSTAKCTDAFDTADSCFLFYASGRPAVAKKFSGSIASFSISRGGDYVADYVPYRFDGQCGFFDRVSGVFKGCDGLSGSVDETSPSPLTSVTEPLSGMRINGRSIFVLERTDDMVTLGFGTGNGCANRLYMGWGSQDGGTSTNGWDHVDYLGEVTDVTGSWRAELPNGARVVRFFLERPVDTDECVLECVSGDGTHCIDTGIVLKGGDDIRARVRPDVAVQGSVFGSRGADVNTADIVMAFSGTRQFVLDYCGSGVAGDYANYRLVGDAATIGQWYDAMLSADIRSLAEDGGTGSSSTAKCTDAFDTVDTCRLFGASGRPSVPDKFRGSVAYFSIRRGSELLADYLPFRRGAECGFFDRVTGSFVAAEGLGGTDCQGAAVPVMTVSSLLSHDVVPTKAGTYRGEVAEDTYARMTASFDLVAKIMADGSTNFEATVSVDGKFYSYQDVGNGEEMCCPIEIDGKTYWSYFAVALLEGNKAAVDGSVYLTADDEIFFCGFLDGALVEWENSFIRADPMNESAADMGITAGAFRRELPRSETLIKLQAWGAANNVRITDVNAVEFTLEGDPTERLGASYLLDCAPTDEAIRAAQANLVITSFDSATESVEVCGQYASGDAYGNGRIEVRSATEPCGPYTATSKTGVSRAFYRAFLVK